MKDEAMKFFEKLAEEGRLEEVMDKFANDPRIPNLPATRFFTPTQADALEETIPMTQEIFDKCLYVCDHIGDGVSFHRIVEQFPDMEVKYSKEVQEKYKREHDEYKKAYLAKWGKDAWFFLDQYNLFQASAKHKKDWCVRSKNKTARR